MVQSSLSPRKVTRDDLNSLVDRAADLIRTAVDYKFILVLLFLKRLNDIWKVEKAEVKNRLVKESGWTEEEADKESTRKKTKKQLNDIIDSILNDLQTTIHSI
jgi:type I restriction enzyme M protein